MTGIATHIITIIGSLGGLSGIIAFFFYYKENKKRKQVETRSIDIKALSDTIDILQKDKEKMHKDLQDMRAEIDTLKKSLRLSDSEKIGLERDLNIFNRAMVCRYECDKEHCPIELKIESLVTKRESSKNGQANS